jgi:lipoate-protein ligase A
MDRLKKSLRPDKSCYTTRAVDSNPSSVMNLNEKLTGLKDINDFSLGMIRYFSENMPDLEFSGILQRDADEASLLADTRYRTWAWNFAYGPDYVFRNDFRFENSLNTVTLHVTNGIVMKCSAEGNKRFISIAEKFTGCRHMVPDFLNVFEKENIQIQEEEIFNFF